MLFSTDRVRLTQAWEEVEVCCFDGLQEDGPRFPTDPLEEGAAASISENTSTHRSRITMCGVDRGIMTNVDIPSKDAWCRSRITM
jgi:hypothetical protein